MFYGKNSLLKDDFFILAVKYIFMYYKFIIFLFLSLFFHDLNSQNLFNQDVLVFDRETKLEKANISFETEKYGEAYALFKELYRKEKNKDIKIDFYFLQAECLRLTNTYNNLRRAEQMYDNLIRKKFVEQEKGYIVYYNLGLVLQMQGKYEEALDAFSKFKQLSPNHDLINNKLKSCQYAISQKGNTTRYELERFNMASSKDFDFAPSYSGNDYSTLYFTSNRKNDEVKGNDAGSSIGPVSSLTYDIWSIKYQKERWSKPTLFKGPINSPDHEAAATTTVDGKTIYFTRCSMPNEYDPGKNKKPYCRIFFTQLKDEGWTSPVLLPLPYDSVSNFGHPVASKDGKKIFFSSDMKGTYGQNDIWFIQKIARDEWSYPVNLGPNINTAGNEIYPFLHLNGKTLYFSSDGRVGFGGYDIFKSEWDRDGNLISVHNMKSPINSAMNDYSLILEQNSEKGYLSTDRSETQNGDIYFVKLAPIILTVSGVVTEEESGTIISNAMVKILGTNNSIDSIYTDNAGRYEFKGDFLSPGNSYSVSVKKKDYESVNAEFSTIDITDSKDIQLDFEIVNVMQDVKALNEPNSNIAFFDYNSYQLREDALKELDSWADYILKYEGLVFQINAYADFRGKDPYNIQLSLNRAMSCKKYLVEEKGIDADRILVYAKGEQEPYVMDYNDGKFKKGDVLSQEYISKLRKKSLIEKAHQYNRRSKIIWLEDKRFDKVRGGVIDY